ncbi:MAG TPA: hypothetical protein VMU87_01500 [Stellaceae bacterium]|nr:hypothetical protein [Stellaceae bacterium]
MQDVATALDNYLLTRFGISFERAIADATAGVVSLRLARSVQIVCDPVARYAYPDGPDGGVSEQYQGVLTVEGVAYRFRCSVFEDAGGTRYVESIGEIAAIGWGVRLSLSRR